MFENILGQSAPDQLIQDISRNSLAPAMLFHGPPASGKGSTALELARVISCEGSAAWDCGCASCARHRLLLHPDLLCLGNRSFTAEIAASSDAFLRERSGSARILFIRSVRKLLARFNHALWEDEPKFSKLSSLTVSVEDGLDELEALMRERNRNGEKETAPGKESPDQKDLVEKAVAAVVRDAVKLESGGISDVISIDQIRRAAWWSHLAPAGKGKFLLIENADSMKEGGRNSLLKILEEPPVSVTLVLTSSRPNALLQTILSRLRPYRFSARSAAVEKEVMRRVFRSGNFAPRERLGASGFGSGPGLLSAYLDSFLPVPDHSLQSLAAFFAASAAYKAARLVKKQGLSVLPPELVLLGKHSAALAEDGGFEKSREAREAVAKVLEGAQGFEARSLFPRFLNYLLSTVRESLAASSTHSVSAIGFLETFRQCAGETETSVMIYNQNPGLALERLFTGLSRGMAGI